MTRDELYTLVEGETHRSDLTALIPTWALEVEQHVNRELRVPQMLDTATLTFTAGYAPKPADFLAVRSLKIGDYIVTAASVEDMDPLDTSGTPKFYSIVGDQIRVMPQPGTTGALTYYAAVPPLADNTENWLLTAHQMVYRAGILQRACAYVEDITGAANWERQFEQALRSVHMSVQPGRLNARARAF